MRWPALFLVLWFLAASFATITGIETFELSFGVFIFAFLAVVTIPMKVAR